MQSDFIEKSLEEICLVERGSIISGPFGSNISSKIFQEKGIPVIRGNNLSNNLQKFIDEGFVFLTQKKADELNSYAIEDDLIFTAAGTIGQVGIIPKTSKYDKYVISNKQLRARVDNKIINPLYAFYWFASPWTTKNIINKNTGSTVPLINLGILRSLKIKVPKSRVYQDKIINIIDSISNKIELNNKINTELEAMAKTIYNYWFVQFDFPNEEGKPYKTSGGEMVWNEELKREIPKGWEVKSLYDIAIYTNGLAMQKHRPKGEDKLPVIKIKEMSEGFSSSTEFAKTDIGKDYLIKSGDVLFSWSASLNVMIWANKVGALNQHIFKVTSGMYPRYFIYYQIMNYLNHFKIMAENRKTTMGHITLDHLRESRIVVPNDGSIIKMCGEKIEPILDLVVKNNMQNQELIRLRDFLLPLLMNGQVKVK